VFAVVRARALPREQAGRMPPCGHIVLAYPDPV